MQVRLEAMDRRHFGPAGDGQLQDRIELGAVLGLEHGPGALDELLLAGIGQVGALLGGQGVHGAMGRQQQGEPGDRGASIAYWPWTAAQRPLSQCADDHHRRDGQEGHQTRVRADLRRNQQVEDVAEPAPGAEHHHEHDQGGAQADQRGIGAHLAAPFVARSPPVEGDGDDQRRRHQHQPERQPGPFADALGRERRGHLLL